MGLIHRDLARFVEFSAEGEAFVVPVGKQPSVSQIFSQKMEKSSIVEMRLHAYRQFPMLLFGRCLNRFFRNSVSLAAGIEDRLARQRIKCSILNLSLFLI